METGFDEAEYVAEYSEENRKHGAGDTRPLLDYATLLLRDQSAAEILEIGPGPGWTAIQLAQAHPGVRVTGIDVSQAFIDMANQNKVRAGVQDRVTFVQGDATTMTGFANAAFDLVVSHQSLHYWDSPPHVFDQIARVLRANGAYFISDDRRDLSWLGNLQVFLGMRVLSRRIGASWRESLRGCFTAAEMVTFLQSSDLRDRWELVRGPRVIFIKNKPIRRAASSGA